MTKFILLNAFTLEDFVMNDMCELEEAAEEFGCELLKSKDLVGTTTYYFTAKTKEAIIAMCESQDLPGIVLEYSAIYDQFVEA